MKDKKIKIRNGFNKPTTKGKTFLMPSLTVPDLSLSMREMIDRVGNGQGVLGLPPVYSDPVYEELGKSAKTLDLVQMQELREYYNSRVKEKKQELYEQNQRAKEARKAREAVEREKLFNEWKERAANERKANGQ